MEREDIHAVLNYASLSLDQTRAHRGQPLTTDIGSRVIRWAVSILENDGCIIGYQSFIGWSTIDKYTEDIAVSSQRIQNELGFKPPYDLRAGWEETIREMRYEKVL